MNFVFLKRTRKTDIPSVLVLRNFTCYSKSKTEHVSDVDVRLCEYLFKLSLIKMYSLSSMKGYILCISNILWLYALT